MAISVSAVLDLKYCANRLTRARKLTRRSASQRWHVEVVLASSDEVCDKCRGSVTTYSDPMR
jgi:hypothetical protein